MMKKYVLLVFCVMMASGLSAQISGSPTSEKVVTLVVSGNGVTKEEATQNALRSAIEQSYGTFVSANTKVLNDEMIKDEIATVSSGNIISFKELSITQMPSGLYDASIQATVSIDQLTKFAQSKGMQAELAGATFVMNMKMRELNKKNEISAIEHMMNKITEIGKNGLCDYNLEIDEPRQIDNSKYAVKVKINFIENNNTKAFYKTIYDTFWALSLRNDEILEYKRANLDYYPYDYQLSYHPYSSERDDFFMRNHLPNIKEYINGKYYYYPWFMPLYIEFVLNYEIKDNIGNVWYCKAEKINFEDYDGYKYMSRDNRIIWKCSLYEGKEGFKYYNYLYPSEKILGEYIRADHPEWGSRVPIKDYGYNTFSFNPIEKDRYRRPYNRGEDKSETKNGVLYQQEFHIIYSEEELSRLNSITINHRKY